jgi:hypothetical protein
MHVHCGFALTFELTRAASILLQADPVLTRRHDVTDENPFVLRSVSLGKQLQTEVKILPSGTVQRECDLEPDIYLATWSGVIFDAGFPDLDLREPEPTAEMPADVLPFLTTGNEESTSAHLENLLQTIPATLPTHQRAVGIKQALQDILIVDPFLPARLQSSSEITSGRITNSQGVAQVAAAALRLHDIPARIVKGWISDVTNSARRDAPGFNFWTEAWIGGEWQTFDPSVSLPQIGRIASAVGADVESVTTIVTTAPAQILAFDAFAEEVTGSRFPVSPAFHRASSSGRTA